MKPNTGEKMRPSKTEPGAFPVPTHRTRRYRKPALFLLAVLFGVSGFPAVSALTENDTDPAYEKSFRESYRIMPPVLPDTLDFAGEPVPLDFDFAHERLDRELMVNIFWQSNQLLWIKRANRYFPVIEPILASYGIPDDFKFLCLVESGLMNVVSPAKAAGFWQLLAGTARDLGLEVNDYIDERYHLEKATGAACRYLNTLYEHFGSWTLAAAAYNTGKSNIDYHLRTQGISSYYHMHLPEETSRYVFRMLAEKLILGDPEKYGFHVRPQDLYPPLPVREIRIDTTVRNLFDFAREQGVSYQTLKRYNPWLRERQLPNRSARTYFIALPAEPEKTKKTNAPAQLPPVIPQPDTARIR